MPGDNLTNHVFVCHIENRVARKHLWTSTPFEPGAIIQIGMGKFRVLSCGMMPMISGTVLDDAIQIPYEDVGSISDTVSPPERAEDRPKEKADNSASLREIEEQAKLLGAMNRRLADIDKRVKDSLFNWEYNRAAEVEGMHPAAKAYLLEQWELEKQEHMEKALEQAREKRVAEGVEPSRRKPRPRR